MLIYCLYIDYGKFLSTTETSKCPSLYNPNILYLLPQLNADPLQLSEMLSAVFAPTASNPR